MTKQELADIRTRYSDWPHVMYLLNAYEELETRHAELEQNTSDLMRILSVTAKKRKAKA